MSFFQRLDSGSAGRKLDQILALLEKSVNQESDLKAELDTIKTGVSGLLSAATTNAKTIADLQAQVAAGSPVSQQQLDDLSAEAQGIVAQLTPLAPPTT